MVRDGESPFPSETECRARPICPLPPPPVSWLNFRDVIVIARDVGRDSTIPGERRVQFLARKRF